MNKKLDRNLVELIENVASDHLGDILIKPLDCHIKTKTVCEDCPIDDNNALFANYLQSNGYGNVNKALEEFANDLIESLNNYENDTIDIDELIKIRLRAHCE